MNYDSVQEIKQVLTERGLGMTKKFGQNFLVSGNVRRKIVSILDAREDERVWEIGPGLGAMTELLYGRVGDLSVFEIDFGFIDFLRERFSEEPGEFRVVEGDFLKTGIPRLEAGEVPDKILGNLPYSSGTTMIFRIVETGNFPKKMVFTLQREVAQRMTAQPGSKEYSLFSVICSFAFNVSDHGDIQPGAFYPQPEVVSRIVELSPHGRFESFAERKLFFILAKDMFASRRKTIKNNLFSGVTGSIFRKETILSALKQSGLDPTLRGETLDAGKIAELAVKLRAGSL